MRIGRTWAAMGLGAFGASALLLAPALRAQEDHGARTSPRVSSAVPRSGFAAFTPAAADPKLAAVLARSGLGDGGFRFTPSEARRTADRGVTVAVRAHSARAVSTDRASTTPASLSLSPIAYNLGVSVGWKRFAVSGDVARVDLVSEPGGREQTDVGVSYSGKRLSGRVAAVADKPLTSTPVLIGDKPSYSIDVGGSYSLTRNLAVTAGVRYKSERDRLTAMTEDNRRDSQSVYVGTAFRF